MSCFNHTTIISDHRSIRILDHNSFFLKTAFPVESDCIVVCLRRDLLEVLSLHHLADHLFSDSISAQIFSHSNPQDLRLDSRFRPFSCFYLFQHQNTGFFAIHITHEDLHRRIPIPNPQSPI